MKSTKEKQHRRKDCPRTTDFYIKKALEYLIEQAIVNGNSDMSAILMEAHRSIKVDADAYNFEVSLSEQEELFSNDIKVLLSKFSSLSLEQKREFVKIIENIEKDRANLH